MLTASRSSSMINEVDINFRISGVPHEVVEEAENSRVRKLVQQNNAYNPFSEKSKKMIKDMGNVELFELCETNHEINAKNAFFTGIEASFIALAGIS